MVSDIRQRMTEGKLIDPPGDSARDLLTNLRASAPNRPEVEEVAKALSTRLLDSGKQATAAKAFDRANQLISAAKEVGNGFNAAARDFAVKHLSKQAVLSRLEAELIRLVRRKQNLEAKR